MAIAIAIAIVIDAVVTIIKYYCLYKYYYSFCLLSLSILCRCEKILADY